MQSPLDGLPQDDFDAHKPGPDGKIRITTNYPDFPELGLQANARDPSVTTVL